jgi:uncharacterized membrane-anchored protein YhcB (DUF1043 family)
MAAELQDHLMTASCDLERLQRLLNDASESLLSHFNSANGLVDEITQSNETMKEMRLYLGQAIVALQFHDMATQLIAHTNQRLHVCAAQLAREALADDEDGTAVVEIAPLRPNPVTQDEMDAGSVDLF